MYELRSPIIGCVVSNDYSIVGVVLCKDRVQCLLDSEVFVVVVARSYHTYWELLVLAYIVFGLHFLVLLRKQSLLVRIVLVVDFYSINGVTDVEALYDLVSVEHFNPLFIELLSLCQNIGRVNKLFESALTNIYVLPSLFFFLEEMSSAKLLGVELTTDSITLVCD